MDFQEIYKYDIFANETGAKIVELSDECAIMELTVEKRHLNAGKSAHGGVIFLLADITMAARANCRQIGSVSIQSDIRYFAAALEGDTLRAKAVEVFGRKSLYNCRTEITNQNGDLVAVAEGMFYVKKSFSV
ncbi:MAG: PaaI family thioesterase [Rikenellaceae bacterium]